jgi:hypothetical protein
MSAPNLFRGKWDVAYYRRAIGEATARDVPELEEALRQERALCRPRKGLVRALKRRLGELAADPAAPGLTVTRIKYKRTAERSLS